MKGKPKESEREMKEKCKESEIIITENEWKMKENQRKTLLGAQGTLKYFKVP